MLSINSLSENLLPNIYVKSIDLQTKFSSQTVDSKNPKYQGSGYHSVDSAEGENVLSEDPEKLSESNITLSVKNLKSDTYSEDIIELLNSEFSDHIKIYAHQITDRFLYENLLEGLSDPSQSIQDLEISENGNFTSVRDILTREDSQNYVTNLKTKVFSFLDIPLWNKMNMSSTFSSTSATEQVLSDGTVLNEGILNLKFSFKKDTSFLAYIFIVGVRAPELKGTAYQSLSSKPTMEILLLDGKFQNMGVVFRISADQGYDALTPIEMKNFGKPGDIWAGGVHIHNGRYMAGTSHTNQPHAYLDYNFVEMFKYTDNRLIDKSIVTPFNVGQQLDSVESTVNVFKNNLKLSKFSEYKKKSYAGDIYLSHDKKSNINGVFFVDKYETVRNNCAFPFIFENINLAFNNTPAKGAEVLLTSELMSNSPIVSLKMYGPYYRGAYSIESGLLKTENEESLIINSSLEKPTPSTNSDSSPGDTNFVIAGVELQTKSDYREIDKFIFKHYMDTQGGSVSKELKYKYIIEYKDPTIRFMRQVLKSIKMAKKDTITFLNYANSQKLFDEYSQKIKDSFLKSLNPNNFDWVSTTGDSNSYYINNVLNLSKDTRVYAAFYNRNADNTNTTQDAFMRQLKSLSRFDTTTLDKLNVLLTFLSNLESTIQNSLDSVSNSKLSKNSIGVQNQFSTSGANKNSGDINSAKSSRTIRQESQEFSIKVSDHGYDFTRQFQRDINNFFAITVTEYKRKCQDLFATQFSSFNTLGQDENQTEIGVDDLLGQSYKPKGLKTRQPKQDIYSFLNIPINNSDLKHSVILPETVIQKWSQKVNLQHVLLGIVKRKNEIFENNSKFGSSPEKILSDQLLSILGESGSDKNEIGAKSNKIANQSSNNSLVQKNVITPVNDLGNLNESKVTTIAGQELDSNKFKIEPPKTVELANDLPNYFLLSILYRKLFTNTINQVGFKLNISKNDFGMNNDLTKKQISELQQNAHPPLNVLCLSIDEDIAEGVDPFGPLKNFVSSDQTYIKNGVVNPALMSYFWFIHQNIVEVQYLDDFEKTSQTSLLKNGSGFSMSENTTTIKNEYRNIKKPIFKRVTEDVLSSKIPGSRLLCRLKQYENPIYINKKLLKEFKMPLLNNYFILEIA